nr:type II toxin-antitoxin system HicA family toxin [Methanococcoides seepicolus]
MLQVPELPIISGQKVIKTLVKLGFVVVRQKGSHVFLQRESDTVTVPLHDPVKKGTLKSILKQANVSLDDFLRVLK